MEISNALSVLASLSQETRLRIFKCLVEYGPSGAAAGLIAEQLGVPHNTLSFHLAHLTAAHLVVAKKSGRNVIYSTNRVTMKNLVEYLNENCCARDDIFCIKLEANC
jgi:DNA-binding transcriptional ArsR family regulator